MTTLTEPTPDSLAPAGGAIVRCVGDVDRFVAEHWARAPLHRPGASPDAFADLFTLADVDHLLATTSPRPPAFRLVKDGRPLDPATYTKHGRMGSRPLSDLADVGRIYDHFHGGATIVLQGLQRYWLPLTRFCRDLELFLTHPTQVNAYVTPPASQGFKVHHDTHDVFVLQVHGHKAWQVHEPVVRLPLPGQGLPPGRDPGPPLVDVELAPGDCLYVPRGFPHAARSTAAAASVHLTVGMLTYTWNDLLRDAVAQAADEEPFREALPIGFADDPDRFAARVAERVDELARRLGKVDARQVAERASRRFWTSRPPLLAGQLQQLLGLDRVGDDSVVRRRPGSICRLHLRDGELVVLLGDRELHMPARLEPALRALLAADRLAVRDLAPHLDQASRGVLVRRLVREGVLESVGVG